MDKKIESYLHVLINANTLPELDSIRAAVRANDGLAAARIPFADLVEYIYTERRTAVATVRAPRYAEPAAETAATPSRQAAVDHRYQRPPGVPGVDPDPQPEPGDGGGL
jgi:hypothetical protein